MIPALFFNLRKALVPLMHDDTYRAMQQVVDRVGMKQNSRVSEKMPRIG